MALIKNQEPLTIDEIIKKSNSRSVMQPSKLQWIAETVRECEGIEGELCECGVAKGGSAAVICSAAPNKLLHAFDTFTGLPASEGGHSKGDFACPLDDVKEFLKGYKVQFHPGLVPETLKELPEGTRFAFIYLDMDLYFPTKAALEILWPLVMPLGYMLCDDRHWAPTPGIDKAIDEFFKPEQIEEHENQCRIRKSL